MQRRLDAPQPGQAAGNPLPRGRCGPAAAADRHPGHLLRRQREGPPAAAATAPTSRSVATGPRVRARRSSTRTPWQPSSWPNRRRCSSIPWNGPRSEGGSGAGPHYVGDHSHDGRRTASGIHIAAIPPGWPSAMGGNQTGVNASKTPGRKPPADRARVPLPEIIASHRRSTLSGAAGGRRETVTRKRMPVRGVSLIHRDLPWSIRCSGRRLQSELPCRPVELFAPPVRPRATQRRGQ